ncbi:MAG: hypothetical protein ACK43J_06445 [Chitinophagaceae bacterium]|jgi:hypothetical protein
MRKLLLIICLLPLLSNAQGSRVAVGESSIRIESFMSQNEAEERVIELAKVDALIREFGQYVEQQSNLDLQNGKVDFRSYGQTKVKGEWIRTLGDPEIKFDERMVKGKPERWITCKIKGEVRRAIPKADLEVEILGCPEKSCITEKFKSDQNLYLYVKSPLSGFLSVFLDDGTNVYRLLPYRSMEGQKSVKISADKEYILFSTSQNKFNQASDALQVFTEREYEANTLIIIFSENDYSKPRLNEEQIDQNNLIIPKSLSKNYFENWLGNNRAAFPDFLDIKKRITITAK